MQRHTPWLLYSGAALALSACAAPAVSPAAGASTAQLAPITAEGMRARISFLASDALRGRDTPSQGLEAAATYLASESARLGLEPAGEEGTYYQRYPFPLRRLAVERTSLTVRGPRAAQTLRYGSDFFAAGGTAADVEGGLVFVGREFTAGAGASGTLRERIVVAALPGAWSRDWRTLRSRQTRQAEQQGARAVIHVLDPSWTPEQISQSAAQAGTPARTLGDAVAFPEFFVSYAAAQRVFSLADVPLDEAWQRAIAGEVEPITLPGVAFTGGAPQELIDLASAPNVAAVLRGGDPALRDEYVILSAHMDHVGVGSPMNGDSIYNGADDNASGTSALIEVARAMSALPTPPRRSVIFLWVSGEEKGLLGSRWYSDNPTVPLEQVVANINVDMIAQNAPDTVVVIGKDYSTLGQVVNRVNAQHPELNLTASDDIWPEERFFFRSDHFNFARKEVPAIFFFTGVHECYHRACDEVDFINPDKAARVATLIFHVVRDIADADQRPVWDPAGLEEVRALTR